MARCKDCIHFAVCSPHTEPDESYPEVGGCPAFKSKDDFMEVVHGRWIPLEADGYADGNPVWDLWECSECRDEHSGDEDTLTPYCPNCGAKMDGRYETEG